MKKLLRLALILAVTFALVMPAHAAYRDYWAKVYSWDGTITDTGLFQLKEITSGVTYVVLMKNSSATIETLYAYGDPNITALANPVTGTNFESSSSGKEQIRFRTDPSEVGDLQVDLLVTNQAGGYSAFIEDFDVYTHAIVIDQRPNIKHHGVFFIDSGTASTGIETGIEFEDFTLVHDMVAEVAIAFDSNMAFSVGLATAGTEGLSSGFISAMGLGTVGFHSLDRPGIDLTIPMVTENATSSRLYYLSDDGALNGSIELNIGTWMGHLELAEASGETGGTVSDGLFIRQELLIHGTMEKSLTYSFDATSASTGWGLLHYWFTRIR
jgi:hypothetical protein